MDYHWYGASGAFHDLEIGVRFHYDEEDRFQWEDGYHMANGDMELVLEGAKGAKGNRISSAQVWQPMPCINTSLKDGHSPQVSV